MASQIDYPLVTAKEFLEMSFGDRKAELDNGVIRMMAGGTARHAEVQGNILAWLRQELRGSGCRPYGSDMATQTHDISIRYPDVSIFSDRNEPIDREARAFDDPRVLFEVLSAGTARTDLRVKLHEYQALDSVDTIIFVDIAAERLRIVQRTAAHGWSDVTHDDAVDAPLPALGLVIPHDEISRPTDRRACGCHPPRPARHRVRRDVRAVRGQRAVRAEA